MILGGWCKGLALAEVEEDRGVAVAVHALPVALRPRVHVHLREVALSCHHSSRKPHPPALCCSLNMGVLSFRQPQLRASEWQFEPCKPTVLYMVSPGAEVGRHS